MNDIDLLDAHGPQGPELSGEAWSAARARLVAEIAEPAPASRPRRRWISLLVRLTAVGLAGVAAVAVTIAALPDSRFSGPVPDARTAVAGPRPIRLVAATAPQFPFTLPGFGKPVYTADPGGPVMAVFGDTDTSDTVVLLAEPEEPGGRRNSEVDGRPARISDYEENGTVTTTQLTWERRPGQWVTLVGNGRYAGESEVLRLARTVVDDPQVVGFKLTLGLAPDGWVLGGFKGDDRLVSIISYQEPGTGRELHVVWYGPGQREDAGWEGFEAEYPVTVNKRKARLVQATERWILVGTFTDGSTYQLMAPRDFSRAQVLELAGSVRMHP
ncbi:hypothetical protein AB0F81_01930 [Actinoplanes sp. NPDC024001]|uniref:hypothetical protein n=1 Tax=Actinoplanes sp. NPDC024001 TaxID=3154598 RepID=UPI0033EA17F4